MFLGRHEPRKGLDVLLDALPSAAADVRLWVGGDGPETAGAPRPARRRPADRVARSASSDDEKAPALRGADVFCAPSLRGESFGIVLLEAMAAGTAVVASDLPATRNVARADVDGLLVPPGDTDALAGALDRALADDDLRARLVASGDAERADGLLDGATCADALRPSSTSAPRRPA